MARFVKMMVAIGDSVKYMSKETFNAIIQAVEHFPQGASAEEILFALKSRLPRRSLQRYLSLLSKEGNLIVVGKARSRKYQIPSPEQKVETPEQISFIPLSSTALSIQTSVRQPIQARHPVGYNREFLTKYKPNETYYLSENLRDHLQEIGRSNHPERPAGTYARNILNRLLIDLSWNSSRLEGNTYSLLETERLLDLGEVSEGKSSKEAQMILNHKAAIEFMVDTAENLRFNSFTICSLHALLSDNLLQDQRALGCLRTAPVGIAKSVYQPLAVPQLVHEYFQKILDIADAIQDPYEQSFFIMVQLPYLQPFLDVNKRVSRLAANIPFIRENLCPLSFVDVPEQVYVSGLLGIYELNRIELFREVFVWAYERSSALYSATRQELGEPDLFRLKYRNLIKSTVGDIITGGKDKKEAVNSIKKIANEFVSQNDRSKFIEIVEIELMSLHKGNIARFRIRPSEYDLWLKNWK